MSILRITTIAIMVWLACLNAGCLWEPYPIIFFDKMPQENWPPAVVQCVERHHPQMRIESVTKVTFKNKVRYDVITTDQRGEHFSMTVSADGKITGEGPLVNQPNTVEEKKTPGEAGG